MIIGIDLGTTNSLAAYWENGKAKLIPNALGQHLTPSVVGLDNQGQVIIGEAAKHRLRTQPGLTAAMFKRHMGTSKTLRLGNTAFRPEELSALVIKSLKHDAEALFGEPVSDAVISVPAYFNDTQRKATKTAGMLAGLNVKRLINEPTAAAIAFGLHQQDSETTFLVFDIGGGTFDVAILELFDGVMQVHASAGDNRLGGEDYADALSVAFAKHHQLRVDDLTAKQLAGLRAAAEACKQSLSQQSTATMSLNMNTGQLNMPVSRERFKTLTDELNKRVRKPLERAFRDADLSPDDIDKIVLVGGASRMPVIRSLVSTVIGRIPTVQVNPDETIALGIAVQIGLMENDRALKEIVLTDVAPYSLGVEIHNSINRRDDSNLFSPIIERNSPVPISRVETYYTTADQQRQVRVGIYQGESRLAKDNIKLGELAVAVPPAPAGHESIDIRFTYDINGLLEVESRVVSTGVTARVVIESHSNTMTATDIEQRLKALADLKIHPRDRLENAVLLARGERLYEDTLGETRTLIANAISHFEAVLDRQQTEEIAKAVSELAALLDAIEARSKL